MKNTLLVTLSLVALLSGGCAKKAESADSMDDAKKESAPAAEAAEAADATDAASDSEDKPTADVSESPLVAAAVAPTRLLVTMPIYG